MVHLLRVAVSQVPVERLWVNPDCGLKTRGWPETRDALAAMVRAAIMLREQPGLQAGQKQPTSVAALSSRHVAGCCLAEEV